MNESPRDPPRLATKFWEEYSGKQKLLSTFFGKKASVLPAETQQPTKGSHTTSPEEAARAPTPSSPSKGGDTPILKAVSTTPPASVEAYSIFPSNLTATSSRRAPSPSIQEIRGESPLNATSKNKRKMQADSNYPAEGLKKSKQEVSSKSKSKSGKAAKDAQLKLSTFFTAPKSRAKEAQTVDKVDKSDAIDVDSQSDTPEDLSFLSSISSPISVPGSSQTGKKASTWDQLFAPVKPPLCNVHGEPTQLLKVNKPGPNKGKTFFVCSR